MSESLKSAVQAAVLRLLDPLVRWLLEAGIGVGDFLTLAKIAYVRAAWNQARETGGGRPSISRITVVTGLTRLEVASILAGDRTERPHDLGRRQRAERVLSGWWTDPAFQDAPGRPAILSLRGPKRSFAALVERYSGERSAARPILEELQRVKAVRRMPDGRLKALSRTYATVRWDPEGVAAFGEHVAHLCSTLLHNLKFPTRPNYIREVLNVRLDPRYVPMLRRDLEQQLEVLANSIRHRWNDPAHNVPGEAGPGEASGLGVTLYVFEPESAETASTGESSPAVGFAQWHTAKGRGPKGREARR